MITEFKNIHSGTIFCIGCGPSVNEEDLSLLDGQVVIFLNNATKLLDRFSPGKFYQLMGDHNRICELGISSEWPVITCINERRQTSENDKFYKGSICLPMISKIKDDIRFSIDLTQGISGEGQSSVFQGIQLASYMGASTIALLGIDMDYSNGMWFDSEKSDGRHEYKQFNYKRFNEPVFIKYREVLEDMDKSLINSSCGGIIDVLPRISLGEILN